SYENLLRTDVYARWARDQQEPAPVVAHPRPDAPAQAPADTAPATVATVTGLDALDADMEDHLDSLDESDPLRRRWLDQGKRNDETRRLLAESAAEPLPDIPHDQQVAHAADRWRQLGEKTVIPDEHREKLLALLAAGTTIPEAARALEVTKWTARTYLERLRGEGLVRMEGEKRTAKWLLAEPGGGDGS